MNIYRNLHKSCWSLKDGSEPVRHSSSVLVSAPRFVVQPAGRERVLRERKKHVHAFVRSSFVLASKTKVPAVPQGWVKVSYNPYVCGSFTSDGRPVVSARLAILTAEGQCWATDVVVEGSVRLT